MATVREILADSMRCTRWTTLEATVDAVIDGLAAAGLTIVPVNAVADAVHSHCSQHDTAHGHPRPT